MIINIAATSWRPGWPKRDVSIKRFFRFGGGVLGTQLIAYLTMNIDNIVLGAFKGKYVLGIYSRAYQLLMMPLNQINRPLTRIALPVLSKVQDDQETFERYLRKAQVVGCYVTATVFALTTALSQPIVDILFGSKWKDVIPVLAILAAGGVFRAVSQISYWAYLARGKTGAQFRLYLITRPFMIAIIVAGLPWGAIGVAIGSSTAYALYWLVSMIQVGHAVDIDGKRLLWNATRCLLFVSLPCGLVAYLGVLFVSRPLLQITIGVALAAVYICIVSRIVPFVRSDVATLLQFGRRALYMRSGRATTRGTNS
jgi:PST family polysaccharide transporter